MIDRSDRTPPRVPRHHVARVRADIVAAVAAVDDPGALAVSGAACGGDLLFCEAWLGAGRKLVVCLPREREAFLDESVRFAGPQWEAAFERVMRHVRTSVCGPDPAMRRAANPHAPNNDRMLARARAEPPPLLGLFVWDGTEGDGVGGAVQMVTLVERAGGRSTIIRP